MSSSSSRLVLPAVRANSSGDYPLDAEVEKLPPGGFLLFGGEATAAQAWIAEQHARDPELIFSSDLERGAGQQFSGMTSLPPAAAIARLDDPELAWGAGNLTGREAAAIGIGLVFAPVADLDVERDNPIVGTRAWGESSERVGRMIEAWVRGCQAAGVAACPKHFPGHGRTTGDSHIEMPAVTASREVLAADLEPFAAAFRADAAAVMMAHVAYPALDPVTPASRSRVVIEQLLRREMGYSGLVVTDALDMGGAATGEGSDPAALSFLAGCDLLLMPSDPIAAVRSVEAAAQRDAACGRRLQEALGRRARLPRSPAGHPPFSGSAAEDRQWAADLAIRVIIRLRGEGPVAPFGRLEIVDDDLGGPHPTPSREPLRTALLKAGLLADQPAEATLVAVFAEPRAWKGRSGLSAAAIARCVRMAAEGPTVFVLFGHPNLLADLPPAVDVWCAWGGEEGMQIAAARRLAANAGGRGS